MNQPSRKQLKEGMEDNSNVGFNVVIIIVLICLVIWKIILFRHAARTSNGLSVFFAMLLTPIDAIALLFKKKCLVAA